MHFHEITLAANRIFYHTGKNYTVSKYFIPSFLKWHRDFLVRKQKPLAVARKNAYDIDALLKQFYKYKDLRNEYNIFDNNIWNFDKTRFRIEIGQAQLIITKNTYRKLTLQDPDNRESLTSIESINAIGKATSSYLILSGRQMLEKWFEEIDLDKNASFDISDMSYSNNTISIDWLEHFNENESPADAWQMLVMDGHSSPTH